MIFCKYWNVFSAGQPNTGNELQHLSHREVLPSEGTGLISGAHSRSRPYTGIPFSSEKRSFPFWFTGLVSKWIDSPQGCTQHKSIPLRRIEGCTFTTRRGWLHGGHRCNAWQLNLDHVVMNKMYPVLTGPGDASQKHRHELGAGSAYYSCLAPKASFQIM